MKTRSLMMKKCRNLKNEIKTRWGDSINLLYCSHIINKSRRSDVYSCVLPKSIFGNELSPNHHTRRNVMPKLFARQHSIRSTRPEATRPIPTKKDTSKRRFFGPQILPSPKMQDYKHIQGGFSPKCHWPTLRKAKSRFCRSAFVLLPLFYF